MRFPARWKLAMGAAFALALIPVNISAEEKAADAPAKVTIRFSEPIHAGKPFLIHTQIERNKSLDHFTLMRAIAHLVVIHKTSGQREEYNMWHLMNESTEDWLMNTIDYDGAKTSYDVTTVATTREIDSEYGSSSRPMPLFGIPGTYSCHLRMSCGERGKVRSEAVDVVVREKGDDHPMFYKLNWHRLIADTVFNIPVRDACLDEARKRLDGMGPTDKLIAAYAIVRNVLPCTYPKKLNDRQKDELRKSMRAFDILLEPGRDDSLTDWAIYNLAYAHHALGNHEKAAAAVLKTRRLSVHAVYDHHGVIRDLKAMREYADRLEAYKGPEEVMYEEYKRRNKEKK